MTSQATAVRVPPAWVHFLRAHASITRALNTDLLGSHRLTLSDYEVLLRLAHAPDRRLRRVDLAEGVLLTASGVTRLLDGLERAGLVEKATCASDARVTYACLTEGGEEKLKQASRSHVAEVRALFAQAYSDEELETLARLLARLGDGSANAAECTA